MSAIQNSVRETRILRSTPDPPPNQSVEQASASTQTASSIDSAPCHEMAGVGQTLVNVTDTSRNRTAAQSATQRRIGFERICRRAAPRVTVFIDYELQVYDGFGFRHSLEMSTRKE